MYASFLNLPEAGRHLRALHLKLFTVPSVLTTFCEVSMFNWIKKVEVVSQRAKELFKRYPGGRSGFFQDFKTFFQDKKRFTYTPLILCKGIKPTLPL